MSHTSTSPSKRRTKWSALSTLGTLLLSTWLPSVQAAKSAADYYVQSLPGAPSPLLRMYAGHIEITPEHHGNMFFWLFKNRHIANRQRTVLWLNGGPGCSSMDGALMEIGPYRVNEDQTLRYNDGSWDEFANLLFLDNPVGTGFSYVDGDSYVHELTEMASQVVTFLEKWFAIFPEHAHDDIYIAGESYAGQHIPYIAQAMLDRNAKNQGHEWNVSGLLIGNGWISGEDQYGSYLPLAYEAGLVERGSAIDEQVKKDQEQCDRALKDGNAAQKIDSGVCENIMLEILRLTRPDGKCWNMYDVRLKDDYPSCGMAWPPDLKQLTPYLRRADVLSALHINADKKTGWEECNSQVSSSFHPKTSKPSKTLLPGLLEKMPIILFSGDKDLICNHIGTETLINNLEWNGSKGMELPDGTWAPKRDWTFEGEPAGQYQYARNLTYIRFYNSSHMVPFDYPRRTRDMLDRFMDVDIASIGGTPADSRIDGEKGLEVSVGGHPNSTAAVEAEKDKVKAAAWAAYKRSGEVALFFVIIAAGALGFFIWRDRRRRAGYRNIFGSEPHDGHDPNGSQLSTGLGLDGARGQESRWRQQRDVEAARDFDEAELDELTTDGKERDAAFGLADDEDDDEDARAGKGGRANGHA
ncbi:pheromone-processing carboxypeptidase kex1 [Acrodontium crateriforme]|uniref:Carboxypeptidase n=1 Tax=Acrodontium crateriforme TaxID=150365 RepID=A0AAQ3M1V6_9PEZI|nr:pheromone-processing carboxypeptidase kex1 [Acrodontium crateriforme]